MLENAWNVGANSWLTDCECLLLCWKYFTKFNDKSSQHLQVEVKLCMIAFDFVSEYWEEKSGNLLEQWNVYFVNGLIWKGLSV